eukprot:3749962-Pyramimonas_sp.AAC.1
MMLRSSLEPRGPVSDAPIMPCQADSCTGGVSDPSKYNAQRAPLEARRVTRVELSTDSRKGKLGWGAPQAK